MTLAIFSALVRASEEVWTSLDGFLNVGGFQAREETITENMMLSLMRNPTPGLMVKKISSGEEATNGADFRLVLHRSGRYVQYHLQAKKLYMNDDKLLDPNFCNRTGHYRELFKSPANKKPKDVENSVGATRHDQCDRLVKEAGQTCIPGYLFYNGTARPFPIVGQPLPFGLSMTRNNSAVIGGVASPAGCTFCPAEVVGRFLTDTSDRSDAIAGKSIPWECLVPSDLYPFHRREFWDRWQYEPSPYWYQVFQSYRWLSAQSSNTTPARGCSLIRPTWMEGEETLDDGPSASFGIAIDLGDN
jgi:hypothetical protein